MNDSILCRAQSPIPLPATATGEFMFMPGGLQTINPWDGGAGQPITVQVDRDGVAALNEQAQALRAKGKRPYFDFNHSDGPASFWPEEFLWRDAPEPGIYARGEWTASGKTAVEGKEWRQFSPVFHVDKKLGATPQSPARIVARPSAKPNMGGLVNDPAFHAIAPLWTRDGSDSSGSAAGENQKPNHDSIIRMNEHDLAALRAKNQELEQELAGLKARALADKENAALASEIKAKEAEAKNARLELELGEIKAKHSAAETALQARRKADADSAVKRAVERGAIPAKDNTTQTALAAKATDDAGFIAVIDSLQGNLALTQRVTQSGSGVSIVKESGRDSLNAWAALICRNAKTPLSWETHKQKGKLASECGAIFARELADDKTILDLDGQELVRICESAIRAADYSDSNATVGVLTGTLVLQRVLSQFAYKYPMLSAIHSDFSDAPGVYQQTELTRIVLKPAVQTYSTTKDSAGRPSGWTTVSPAVDIDVPITLDEYVGVPIVFGQATLGATTRNLFAEQAPLVLNALGGYMVNKVTTLMTSTNFNAYAQNTDASCGTTSGSTTITLASTAGLYAGSAISGTGIPSGTYIKSVTDSTDAVMTQAATATATVTATLNGGATKIPTLYTTFVSALADWNLAQAGNIASAFDQNEVPDDDRFLLLSAPYFTKMANDPVLTTYWAAIQNPDLVRNRNLNVVQGFTPFNAPWFPSSSNRVGFAGHRASVVIKTRLPMDFTSAVQATPPGSITTVTVPGGFSVALVEYMNLTQNYAEWRPEVLLGAAVGDRRGGMVITSA